MGLADVSPAVGEKFLQSQHRHDKAVDKEDDQYQSPPPSPSPTDVNSSFGSITKDSAATDDGSVAAEVAKAMGIPDAIIQMVRGYHILQHGRDFSSAQELFEAAEDLLTCPEKQSMVGEKLYEAELARRERKKARRRDYLPEVKADTVKATSVCPPAGMLEKAECAPPVDSKVELKQKVRSLARENQRLRRRKLCSQCQQVDLSTSGVTFLPCGHFITCEACSEQCEDCPACGINVMGTVRTYLS